MLMMPMSEELNAKETSKKRKKERKKERKKINSPSP